jgi:uncharacterized protein (TIGR02186 family)
MSNRLLSLLLSIVFVLGVTRGTQASEISVDLADPVVQITAGFSGTDLLLFGVAPGEGDIVIVVRGPIHDQTVRKKDQVLGVWVNKDEITLEDVPAYYAMASNRSLDEFLPGGIANIHQIGLENLQFHPKDKSRTDEDWDHFRHALLRNKQHQNLYTWDPLPLIFKGNRLFRTKIRFPANVSVGTFGIETYLIRKGELVDSHTTLLNVRKFGVEARVYDFAHRHSFAYGILAIAIACLAGWAANAAFRKA